LLRTTVTGRCPFESEISVSSVPVRLERVANQLRVVVLGVLERRAGVGDAGQREETSAWSGRLASRCRTRLPSFSEMHRNSKLDSVAPRVVRAQREHAARRGGSPAFFGDERRRVAGAVAGGGVVRTQNPGSHASCEIVARRALRVRAGSGAGIASLVRL
jgi:hypothetical protein